MRSPRDTGRGVRAGRLLATATATCVVAAGFLAAPVAGLPWNDGRLQTLAADQHTPDVGAGSPVGQGVSVGVVGTSTSTGPTTLQEVLGVLERAELAGRDAGRKVTPAVEQAAAELGMLLSTYLAQQAAASSDRPFAAADVEAPSPLLPAPTTEPEPTEPEPTEPEPTEPEPTEPETTEPGTTPDVAPPALDVPEVVPVARQVTIDPAAEPDPVATGERPETVQPDAEQPAETGEHVHDDVTFDDVVVAATRLATLLDPATTTLEAGILPAGADGTVAARATLTASLLAVVDRYGTSTAGYANGRIPTSALCPLDFAPGHMLRCDAAEQLSALSEEYEKEFGVPIPMTDSYRTLESQIRLKATKGYLAATPGTSNHGWGLAVDLGLPISTGTSAEYVWMRVHAPDYGWDNPSWARLTGSKPEPWHFEFFAAGPVPDRAWKSDDVVGAGTAGASERADQGTAGGDTKADASDAKADAKDTRKSKGGPSKGGAAEKPGSTGNTSGGKSSGGTTSGGDGASSTPRPTSPAKVTVPDVAGLTLAKATAKLEALGLDVSTSSKPSAAPKGQVLATRGAGTTVAKGSTVSLVVSSGPAAPAKVTVPDVAGLTLAAAKAKLAALGFEVMTEERSDDKVPAGTVLATQGAGTQVAKGSTVAVVVSSGPPPVEKVEIPDVTGLTVSAARAKLEGLGFKVELDPADGVDDDDVIVSTEGAGTTVAKGSIVLLSWAAAEPVPDVAEKTVAAAREELEALGFEVVTEEGIPDDAVVEGTDVEAGTPALLGSEIELVVSGTDE
ncbi:PASTA domain-containing protein [Isoptericola sp. NPDC057391]|uniref:PASTA domain-containing protein n=1 Tax=Isoptericola sp. NPDC057391 TaxID=3346117 RepID=UPI003643388C